MEECGTPLAGDEAYDLRQDPNELNNLLTWTARRVVRGVMLR